MGCGKHSHSHSGANTPFVGHNSDGIHAYDVCYGVIKRKHRFFLAGGLFSAYWAIFGGELAIVTLGGRSLSKATLDINYFLHCIAVSWFACMLMRHTFIWRLSHNRTVQHPQRDNLRLKLRHLKSMSIANLLPYSEFQRESDLCLKCCNGPAARVVCLVARLP